MKYDFHSIGVNTLGRTSGRLKTHCPKCHETRKNKRDKSLSVDIDRGRCHCHHCGYSENLSYRQAVQQREQRRQAVQQQEQSRQGASHGHPAAADHFVRPVYNANRVSTLSDRLTRWFVEQRCIPQEVLTRMHVAECQEWMPQTGAKANCICFHYLEDGRLINIKYRDGAKNFKMVQGAELIPYNIDGILGTPEVIITEGEIDALSFAAIGRTDVVSVPAGATGNLSWLDRFTESHFDDKACIYLAVDNDTKGVALLGELLSRFGPERCRIVHYGPGCKDANDHLQRYGASSLRIALEQAEELPIDGVYTADDLSDELRRVYENGLSKGAETGWSNFDDLCTFELQRLMVVSGVPGDGKSEFTDELVLRLCLRHGWRIAYFSPENLPVSYHYNKIVEKLTGLRFASDTPGMTESIYHTARRFMSDNIVHILPKEAHTIDAILQKARAMVVRKRVRILVIDPLNRIEHRRPEGLTETQYLSELLNRLTAFAVQNSCLVILVAHPRKMNRNPITNRRAVVEMYDISGSAEFMNKADYGVIVERDQEVNVVRIHVEKVKYKHLGRPGVASMVYNMVNGRYSACEESKDPTVPVGERIRSVEFDTVNWLAETGGLFPEGSIPD